MDISNTSKEIPYEIMLREIKVLNNYYISVLSLVPFTKNPGGIRTALAKKIIQIENFCAARNVRLIAILPENDLDYYGTIFNVANIRTIAMLRNPPSTELPTDNYFVSSSESADIEIYNASSVVFRIQSEELSDMDFDILGRVDNENFIDIYVSAKPEQVYFDESSPNVLLEEMPKVELKRADPNAYHEYPQYDGNLVHRIKNTFFEDMINNRPYHPQGRKLNDGPAQ